MMGFCKGGTLQALKNRFGRGFSTTNLRYFRTLYTAYADRFPEIRQIGSGVLADMTEAVKTAINQHLQGIFADTELEEAAVIKQYLITAADGKSYNTRDAGRVTAEITWTHAESGFEKYRIVQDRLFKSDFDKAVKQINTMTRSIPAQKKDKQK